eukprot:TRINITY_DN4076_c0_g2_i13.p2 TRINITY_DN4076_c0_g2~~TRINITY_DN4076_c0_g2_i13.p2  ORF type:complete len:192 (+),score=14.88 TRINITY_DN4076_c0_g2_i13:207-782(+)
MPMSSLPTHTPGVRSPPLHASSLSPLPHHAAVASAPFYNEPAMAAFHPSPAIASFSSNNPAPRRPSFRDNALPSLIPAATPEPQRQPQRRKREKRPNSKRQAKQRSRGSEECKQLPEPRRSSLLAVETPANVTATMSPRRRCSALTSPSPTLSPRPSSPTHPLVRLRPQSSSSLPLALARSGPRPPSPSPS